MTTINTPNSWYDKLKSKIKWQKQSEISEALDIPQELKDYRGAWKEKIHWIDDKTKEKIIKATKKIPVKVEKDGDWSRLIEFKLWSKKYKILDPKLKTHSDDKYHHNPNYNSISQIDDIVTFEWMRWDNVDKWENQKLKEYVKKKQWEGLHIAKIEEIKKILKKIWKKASLSNEKDEIAMLMYLTGMDWWYWLSMWDSEHSICQTARSRLDCRDNNRELDCASALHNYFAASLCMIAVE